MDSETFFIIPRGNPGLQPLQLNVETVIAAERRIPEVAFMTPHKAPELLAVFNKAFLDITRMLSALELEEGSATLHVNNRRSELILDIAPVELAKRGLATSKDLREAVADTDGKYQELLERRNAIKAYQMLLDGKKKSIEMAYTSVKKILGERQPFSSNYTPNTHTSAQTNSSVTAGDNISTAPKQIPASTRFGKARYD
jgi:hypothetical protein